MKTLRSAPTLVTALAVLLAIPASADVYTVTLNNGSTIESRYQPIESPSDPLKIQLLTEFGNWISLEKSIVASILSDTEAKGFGTVLDTSTILLGSAPNDAEDPEAEGQEIDPATALLQYFQQQDAAQSQVYSLEQFVEPSEAGGIPLSFTGTTTPPIGSADRFLTPQDRQ